MPDQPSKAAMEAATKIVGSMMSALYSDTLPASTINIVARVIQAAIDSDTADEKAGRLDWRAQAHIMRRERDEARAERNAHAETLRAIAEMKPQEGKRMRQWAQDAIAGYVRQGTVTIAERTRERDQARVAARELGEAAQKLLNADDWLHAVAQEQDNHLTAISRRELETYSAWNWAKWSGARGSVREVLTKHAALLSED